MHFRACQNKIYAIICGGNDLVIRASEFFSLHVFCFAVGDDDEGIFCFLV